MKKILKEFREFAIQGNMIDMAVGMIPILLQPVQS